MMKKTNLLKMAMVAMLIVIGVVNVHAADYRIMEPLKLTTPTMEPKLEYASAPRFTSPSSHLSPLTSEKYQLTWMRTNEGVKPYKVMDDLTFAGIPIFVAGLIAKSEKTAFAQQRKHALLTEFKTRIDDYAQFFGPVLTTGLKIGGYESRSDWGRYLSSVAMSYGIMAGLVNGIKYTAKEMRPDGSTANSWPSGHTATAFVGATILHKEYGLTRSPWFSIAGYGVATATGVMRVLNNRHWVSDVLSGAGIGIMSTELAYALSDVFFKGKGLLRNDIANTANIIEHPSFFSVSMGIGFGSRNMDFKLNNFTFLSGDFDDDEDSNFNLKFGASTAVAAEGAYFFNKHVGVGGRLRVNSSPIKGWQGVENFAEASLFVDYIQLYELPGMQPVVSGVGTEGTANYQYPYIYDYNLVIESDHLTEFAADLGLYFNFPLSRRFAIGSKLLIGRSIMQEIDLNATIEGGKWNLSGNEEAISASYLGEYKHEWDYLTVGGNNTMKYGTGISLTYAYKSNFSWKLFFDYDFSRKTYTMTYNPYEYMAYAFPNQIGIEDTKAESQSIKKNRNTFILGGSFAISF